MNACTRSPSAVEAVAQAGCDRREESRHGRPRRGGLERVDGVAGVPQRVAQVRRAEALRRPRRGRTTAAGRCRCVPADDRRDLPPAAADEPAAAGDGEDQQAPLGARAAPAQVAGDQRDRPRPTGHAPGSSVSRAPSGAGSSRAAGAPGPAPGSRRDRAPGRASRRRPSSRVRGVARCARSPGSRSRGGPPSPGRPGEGPGRRPRRGRAAARAGPRGVSRWPPANRSSIRP